jgi:hypothetical protein
MTCLSTFPVDRLYPNSETDYWSDYTLHNQVIEMLLACLSLPDQLLCLEQWSYHVPNVQLIARYSSCSRDVKLKGQRGFVAV